MFANLHQASKLKSNCISYIRKYVLFVGLSSFSNCFFYYRNPAEVLATEGWKQMLTEKPDLIKDIFKRHSQWFL